MIGKSRIAHGLATLEVEGGLSMAMPRQSNLDLGRSEDDVLPDATVSLLRDEIFGEARLVG